MNIEQYRQRLLGIERTLAERLAGEVAIARDARADQPAAGDLAHADEIKDEYFALAETDSAVLVLVRAALQRIDDGTFGLCTVDGKPIGEKRLDAVPWTPYCLQHQEMLEEEERVRTRREA